MQSLIQTLIDNKDTLIEGIVLAVKESVFCKKEPFFEDKDDAIKSIDFQYEDVEIFYEMVWQSLKAVKKEFGEDDLKALRRNLFRLVTASIRMMANIDKANESKSYWEYFGEGEKE